VKVFRYLEPCGHGRLDKQTDRTAFSNRSNDGQVCNICIFNIISHLSIGCDGRADAMCDGA